MPRMPPKVKGTIIFAATFTLLGVIFGIRQYFSEPPRDPETHCLAKLEYGHTIVFVDKTDLWNDFQSDRLVRNIISVVSRRMLQEERLTIFSFGERLVPGFPEIFSACKPPIGDGKPNPVVSEDYLRRRYEEMFVKPLRAVMEDVKTATEGVCSPIAEVLVDVLGRHEIRTHPGPTRLVFISDMAQNSALYSVFRGTRCFAGDGRRDHTQDARALLRFFEQRQSIMSPAGTSAIVFQVVPEKNPAHLAQFVQVRWNEVFRLLDVKVEWDRL